MIPEDSTPRVYIIQGGLYENRVLLTLGELLENGELGPTGIDGPRVCPKDLVVEPITLYCK